MRPQLHARQARERPVQVRPARRQVRSERFPDPDRLDLTRPDNRHLAFGWAAHFCFGAPLARLEGQIALSTVLRRLRDVRLEPSRLAWRTNLGLRGLTALPITFAADAADTPPA